MKASPEFMISKDMPLGTRLWWVAALALVGIVLQLFAHILVGWPFVFAAALFTVIKSVSNKPNTGRKTDWQNVTLDEVNDAQDLLDKTEEVRSSAGASGCAGLFFTLVGLVAVTALMSLVLDTNAARSSLFQAPLMGGSFAVMFLVDGLTLILPTWASGRVNAWEPPNMRTRFSQLMYIYENEKSDPRLDFQPSFQVSTENEESVPMDFKFTAKLKDADPDFLGIQIQTSFNQVQSVSYPYTYCVLLAKPGFNLVSKARQMVEEPSSGGFLVGIFADSNARKEAKLARFYEAVIEFDNDGTVDIVVVRQNTSGKGYETTPDQALQVFQTAYELAKGVNG